MRPKMDEKAVDSLVDEILSNEKLMRYFMKNITKKLPEGSRNDRGYCQYVVDQTIDNAFENANVINLMLGTIAREPLADISFESNQNDDFPLRPVFSNTEPINVTNKSPKRVVQKLNKKKIPKSYDDLSMEIKSNQHKNKSVGVADIVVEDAVVEKQTEQNNRIRQQRKSNKDFNTTGTLSSAQKNEFKFESQNGTLSRSNPHVLSTSNLSTCSTVDVQIKTSDNCSLHSEDDDPFLVHSVESNKNTNKNSTLYDKNAPFDNQTDDVEDYLNAWEQNINSNLRAAQSELKHTLALSDAEHNFTHNAAHSHNISSNSSMHDSQNYSESSDVSHDSFVLQNKIHVPRDTKEHPVHHSSSGNKNNLNNTGSTNQSELMFFDQNDFDAEVDFAMSGKEGTFKKRKVHFPSEIVTRTMFRDKITSPAQKAEMFYNHEEEYQFTLDQNKEYLRADALGMTWNDWIALRTDEEVAADDLLESQEQQDQLDEYERYGGYNRGFGTSNEEEHDYEFEVYDTQQEYGTKVREGSDNNNSANGGGHRYLRDTLDQNVQEYDELFEDYGRHGLGGGNSSDHQQQSKQKQGEDTDTTLFEEEDTQLEEHNGSAFDESDQEERSVTSGSATLGGADGFDFEGDDEDDGMVVFQRGDSPVLPTPVTTSTATTTDNDNDNKSKKEKKLWVPSLSQSDEDFSDAENWIKASYSPTNKQVKKTIDRSAHNPLTASAADSLMNHSQDSQDQDLVQQQSSKHNIRSRSESVGSNGTGSSDGSGNDFEIGNDLTEQSIYYDEAEDEEEQEEAAAASKQHSQKSATNTTAGSSLFGGGNNSKSAALNKTQQLQEEELEDSYF